MEPMPLLRRALVATCAGTFAVAVAACGGNDPTLAELAGVDRDGDGVRDDVAEHIASYDPELQEYLFSVAANEQKVVTFDGDTADAYAIAAEVNRLVTCIPSGLDRDAARDAAESVRAQVADTDTRQANERKLSAAISGQTFPEPDCEAESDPSVARPDSADT